MKQYIQIIASFEQVFDLNKTSFEDIAGKLKAYEERIQEEDTHEPQGNLLHENYNKSYNSRGRGRGWNRGRETQLEESAAEETEAQLPEPVQDSSNVEQVRGRSRFNSQDKYKEKKDMYQVVCFKCEKQVTLIWCV